MRDFEILFDHAERSELLDPVFARYGRLGFPGPPGDRPWIYSNFVQSIDGVVSFLGVDGSGQDMSQSAEDRWLMDLLRAHADAVLLGLGTLKLETELCRPRERGPIFRIVDESLHEMRTKLHRGREKNIFVTGGYSELNLDDHAVFDGEKVDPVILTTKAGQERLGSQLARHPQVKVVVAGEDNLVDLPRAMRLLRSELGVKYVSCEGGPTLFGNMLRAGLIDETFLTVSPYIVGQQVPAGQEMRKGEAHCLRPTLLGGMGFTKAEAPHWNWMSCRKSGDHQFHRFRIKRSGEQKIG